MPKVDERGAVLCSYAITVAMDSVRAECLPDSKGLEVSLRYSLEQHREFVLRNSNSSVSDLTQFEWEQGNLESVDCDFLEVEGWLGALEFIEAEPSEYRNKIDELLSVDREPVWNPCL